MKKILTALAVLAFALQNGAFADTVKASDEKVASSCEKPCEIKKEPCEKPCKEHCEKPCEVKKDCSECKLPHDCCDEKRYSATDCWFDNQYKKMKDTLCLCPEVQCQVDKYYQDLRCSLRPLERKIDCQRAKVCKLLEEDDECKSDALSEAERDVDNTKKDMKDCIKTFEQNVKCHLTVGEKHEFAKFMRKEKRKVKQMAKYCSKCSMPCLECF